MNWRAAIPNVPIPVDPGREVGWRSTPAARSFSHWKSGVDIEAKGSYPLEFSNPELTDVLSFHQKVEYPETNSRPNSNLKTL